jgi:hypothetical protein
MGVSAARIRVRIVALRCGPLAPGVPDEVRSYGLPDGMAAATVDAVVSVQRKAAC